MSRKLRNALYAAAAAALLIAFLAAPGVWATPGQNQSQQTVPTRTPTPAPATPTEPPPNTVQPPPGNTPDPGAATPVPPTAAPPTSPSASPAAPTPAERSPLGLTIVADRRQVWPGATVTFTLTLTNEGATPLQQIVVADLLAEGLEPGEIVRGDAAWDGNTLRATAAELPAGGKLELVYTARVTATAPGQAIVTRASATAAGGARAAASLTLGLPPSELPATGGCIEP